MEVYLINLTRNCAINMGKGHSPVGLILRRAIAELEWKLTDQITIDVDFWCCPHSITQKYQDNFRWDQSIWKIPLTPRDSCETENDGSTTELIFSAASDDDQ